MATNMTVKLRKGGRLLDLNDLTRYKIAPGFTPPAVLSQPVLAAGGSANRNQGSKLLDKSAVTRQWAFGLQIVGASEGEVSRRAETLAGMLAQAGSQDEPLFLEYRASSAIAAEPQWGQFGAARRYEITHAQGPTAGTFSGPGHLRAQAIQNAQVNLTIAPYALGKQQALCSALGGVIEDVLGTTDGNSRGTVVPEATTNLFSNPVFGNASYLTAWTVGASLTTVQISDMARTYPGCANAVRVTSTGITYVLSQSLTLPATSHTISFWVRRADDDTVDSNMVAISYNGSNRTSTYTDLGNGIWRVSATVTGTAGAAATGLSVITSWAIEVLGAQCEAKAYATPLACGDFLGHAWSGTAHAASSTSARTAARLRLAISELDNVAMGEGCIRVVWRPHFANTHPNDQYIFDAVDGTHANALRAYFKASDDKVYFEMGGISVSTDALTFSAYSTIVLHFTWGSTNAVLIYVNGVAISLAGPFAASTYGAYLYIGSDYLGTATKQFLGTFQGFGIYGQELTATEVLNDYTDLAPFITSGARVECVPWLHTKDGDDTVDNCIDTTGSTGAPHENFAVMGAIPGSAPADTLWWVDPSDDVGNIYLSKWAIPFFLHPLNVLYFEQSGTAGAASDSSANYRSTTVGTSEVTIADSGTSWESNLKWRLLAGREFAIMARLQDLGANMTLAFRFYMNGTIGGATSVITQFLVPKTINSTATGFGAALSPSLLLPALNETFPVEGKDIVVDDPLFVLAGKRTTGSTFMWVDYMCLLPSPLMAFDAYTNGNVIKGRRVTSLKSGNGITFVRAITGDIIELEPGALNVILFGAFFPSASVPVQATLLYTRVLVTPRYMLF